MDDQVLSAIRQKLGDALKMPFPKMVQREASPALLRGKAHAVIGMRRAGKTFFLYQCLADRLARGIERERLVYFNFEDERLSALAVEDLGTIIEEYYRQLPQFRQKVEGYMLRHKVKPGITGLAQVAGWRGETNTPEKMEKRIECDLRYIREWSLWLDIRILFKTIWVVLWGENAY